LIKPVSSIGLVHWTRVST